ncbi:MAG TPA: hypothetical protein VES67_13770 [Vicinamibacterales bacterium]|nr:hypothetical protein [Vicinamibacterales bacterium]
MIRRLLVMALGAACVGLAAAPARAQNVPHTQSTLGVRAGASGGPEQFFVGAHVETPSLGHNVTFRPNAEIGFGSDLTLVAINLDLVHWSRIPNTEWRVYAGGGVGTNLIFDDFDENDILEGNVNAVIGIQHTSGLYAEMRVGRSPGVKVAAGYVIRR